MDKKAVCNGYAQAMKLLCDLTDVNCEMINGRAGGENHAWNLVKLGKTWYHVDATWDDPAPDDPNRILYQYFNADDRIMAQDHEWDKEAYPIADGKDYNYFILNDLACESFSAFKKKCEEIYEEDTPSVLQIQVWDYDEDTYATKNLHFLFTYSGAWSMSVQNIGEGSRATLYIVLKGI